MTNVNVNVRTIDVETLRSKRACQRQADLFVQLFPAGTPVTRELCVEHASTFDWEWAADKLLPESARAEYARVREPAWAEYGRVRELALTEYERACELALTEYDRVRELAWAEYGRVCAAAFADAFNAD